MTLIEPGRYAAKVVAHAITETKAKDPQASVRLGFETAEGPRELVWFGSFKEGALPHTIKALIACGLKGNNPGDDLTIGQEVSIVVDIDQDQEGKDKNVVRWINAPMGFKKVIEPMTAKAKLEAYSGAVMAAKQEMGIGPKNHAPQSSSHPFAPGNDPWD